MLSEDQAIQTKYKAILKNLTIKSQKCFDCSAKNPIWGDIHFGLFICFHCAGKHRSMGTHISFVRSTTFDKWSANNLKRMLAGGNAKAKEYFSKYGMRISKCRSHTEFYDGKVARRYKEILDREAQQVELDVTTPKITPMSSLYTQGLDDLIGEIDTVKDHKKTTDSKPPTTPKIKEKQEMSLQFNNMIVSSPKLKRRSQANKRKSPESKIFKPKRYARVVSVIQDDCSSDDDFEAEMEEAKSRRTPLISPSTLANEDDEFVKAFSSEQNFLNKSSTKSNQSKSSEVKAVFENKYGKKSDDKSMKSISSADFLKDESTQHIRHSLYQDATSIGSDAFFGREVPRNEDDVDWDDVRNEAVSKAQQLSVVASSWFSSVKDILR